MHIPLIHLKTTDIRLVPLDWPVAHHLTHDHVSLPRRVPPPLQSDRRPRHEKLLFDEAIVFSETHSPLTFIFTLFAVLFPSSFALIV